jgi:putative transposase
MAPAICTLSPAVVTADVRSWAPRAAATCQEVRRRHRFVVLGYVVMPEHFHLLISEPQQTTPSVVMQVLKQHFAHQVLRRSRLAQRRGQGSLWAEVAGEIWQRRFYDFNVWTERKRIEKLRYMHRNPVKRGFVSQPEHWAWSSFRAYAFGEPGPVRINDCQVLAMKVRPAAASEKGVHTHPFAQNAKG